MYTKFTKRDLKSFRKKGSRCFGVVAGRARERKNVSLVEKETARYHFSLDEMILFFHTSYRQEMTSRQGKVAKKKKTGKSSLPSVYLESYPFFEFGWDLLSISQQYTRKEGKCIIQNVANQKGGDVPFDGS